MPPLIYYKEKTADLKSFVKAGEWVRKNCPSSRLSDYSGRGLFSHWNAFVNLTIAVAEVLVPKSRDNNGKLLLVEWQKVPSKIKADIEDVVKVLYPEVQEFYGAWILDPICANHINTKNGNIRKGIFTSLLPLLTSNMNML